MIVYNTHQCIINLSQFRQSSVNLDCSIDLPHKQSGSNIANCTYKYAHDWMRPQYYSGTDSPLSGNLSIARNLDASPYMLIPLAPSIAETSVFCIANKIIDNAES